MNRTSSYKGSEHWFNEIGMTVKMLLNILLVCLVFHALFFLGLSFVFVGAAKWVIMLKWAWATLIQLPFPHWQVTVNLSGKVFSAPAVWMASNLWLGVEPILSRLVVILSFTAAVYPAGIFFGWRHFKKRSIEIFEPEYLAGTMYEQPLDFAERLRFESGDIPFGGALIDLVDHKPFRSKKPIKVAPEGMVSVPAKLAGDISQYQPGMYAYINHEINAVLHAKSEWLITDVEAENGAIQMLNMKDSRVEQTLPVGQFGRSILAYEKAYEAEFFMPWRSEVQHINLVGGSGAGKTNVINQAIERINARGDYCIIHDTKGDLVRKHYRPERDFILNPLDSRCAPWNLFNDVSDHAVKRKADIEAISTSLIPPTKGDDKFWSDAARAVFKGMLHYLYENNLRTNADIWTLLTSNLADIAEKIQSVPGGKTGFTFIQDSSGKQALSVIAVVMQFAQAFEYMAEVNGEFSLIRWLENPTGNIFITSYSDIQDTIKPVLSLFVDLLAKKLLRLPEDKTRRIHFILDEFASLQRMSAVVDLLAKGRSYGACIWLGYQSIGQLDDIYGKSVRQTILDNCGNHAIFRISDPDTAKLMEEKVGETRFRQASENNSWGLAENRDGGGINRQETNKNQVMKGDIMALPNLCAYIKFAEIQPWSLAEFLYKTYPDREEGFICRVPVEEVMAKSATIREMASAAKHGVAVEPVDGEVEIKAPEIEDTPSFITSTDTGTPAENPFA